MIIHSRGRSHLVAIPNGAKLALRLSSCARLVPRYCRIAFYMLIKSLEIFKINKRQALLS